MFHRQLLELCLLTVSSELLFSFLNRQEHWKTDPLPSYLWDHDLLLFFFVSQKKDISASAFVLLILTLITLLTLLQSTIDY